MTLKPTNPPHATAIILQHACTSKALDCLQQEARASEQRARCRLCQGKTDAQTGCQQNRFGRAVSLQQWRRHVEGTCCEWALMMIEYVFGRDAEEEGK